MLDTQVFWTCLVLFLSTLTTSFQNPNLAKTFKSQYPPEQTGTLRSFCKTKASIFTLLGQDKLNLSLSFRLPNHCSVFQAEILAIKEVLAWLRENVISSKDICIFSDSQAAIKSLDGVSTNSRTAHDCRSSLLEMAQQFNIHLCWVPGHRDIAGNCMADELAKKGTTLPISPEKELIGIPIATCKLMLKETTSRTTSIRWDNIPTCTATKIIWPSIDEKRSRILLSLSRSHISSLIGVLTGHCLIGKHATRLGVASNDFCRSCRDEEEEETISHLLCTCPALALKRKFHLGEYFFDDTSELAKKDVKCLLRFIISSKWFSL